MLDDDKQTMWPLAEAGSRRARAWDRSDLLRRLHSFAPATWFMKPPGADPVTCARHGWVNDNTDLLACQVRVRAGRRSAHTGASMLGVLAQRVAK